MNDLSIIIVNYNTKQITANCLQSIYKQRWTHQIEVVVVDNGSSDGSYDFLKKKFSKATFILSKKNLGFAGGNNLGLKAVDARYLLLLNSDTEVCPGSLDNLVNFMDRSNFGIASCKLVGIDSKFQPNAGDLPLGLSLFFWASGWDDILIPVREKLPSFHRQFVSYYKDGIQVGWVSGSVMMIKKEVLEKIGLLDDKIFMYGEDVDYCMRAQRAGFKIGWTGCATIKHFGGGSSVHPQFKQWAGEIRGILYIYQKYYGGLVAMMVSVLLRISILMRIVAFAALGKLAISRTYGKVFISI